jgi:hypothetical protein
MHRSINLRSDEENSRSILELDMNPLGYLCLKRKTPWYVSKLAIPTKIKQSKVHESRVLAVLVPLIIVWEVFIMLKN